MICTLLVVLLLLHRAPDGEISYIVPPLPWLLSFLRSLEEAHLPEVLDHDVLAIIPPAEVLLGVWRAVPAMVDALRLALLAVDEGLRAIPVVN